MSWIASTLALMAVCCMCSLSSVSEVEAKSSASATVWVSPTGSDRARGTRTRPLRTLHAARNRVRRLLRSNRRDVRVLLLGGTHRLSKPLTLTWRDSGRSGQTVTYAAAPHSRPKISGAEPISGFKLYDPALNIYRTKVPAGTTSRQLYVNGRRAVRARGITNPDGFVRTPSGYTAPDASMASWRRPADVELVTTTQWKSMRCPVGSISGRDIAMQQPCWTNVNIFPYQWSFQLITRIENAFELLSDPGEWYLDSAAGWLYYIPRVGEKISNAEFELPLLERLIDGRGTISRPVKNIHFRGLTFSHATWNSPSGPNGYASDQSGFHVTGSGHKPNLIGHIQTPTRTPGAVRFRFAQKIKFVRNSFVRLGAVGLDFNTGSQHNSVVGNRFEDISSAALQLGGIAPEDHHPTSPKQTTRDNKVTNNLIRRTGREYRDAAGIYVGFTTRSRIAHNDISHVPWSGIAIGWGWGLLDPGGFLGLPNAVPGQWGNYTTATTSRQNRIVGNHISRFLTTLWDGGAIYTQGQQGSSLATGELISGNLIRNKRRLAGGNSIYTDGGSRYVTVANNMLFNNPPGITDFGPCGLTDSLFICWAVLPYGTDRGGCRPYGDIAFNNNYWQHPKTFWEACPYPPYPVNVTDQKNTVITGAGELSRKLLRSAGRQGSYRKRVGAG